MTSTSRRVVMFRPCRRGIGGGLRVALLLLTAGLMLVAAAGCRPASDGGDVVTLRFWNGFTGPDGRTMLALVQRFNDENPDVHVTMQRMDWGTYYNKLFVAGMGGRAPEVFVSHDYALGRLMRGRFVRPVDDLTGPGGIDAADFDANVWGAVERDGRHYGIPLDIHLLGMYYNRRLFREAGIVDEHGEPAPPRNRSEFVDALRKLRRDDNGDGRPATWGFVFTWLRTNVYSVMMQFGGGLFDDERATQTLESPENVAALAFCEELVAEGLAPPPQNFDSWVGFLQGRVGIVFEGIYMLPEIRRQEGLEIGAAPMPVLGDRPGAWAGSHNLCLRADLDAREVAAASRFIAFLSDNSLDWAEGGQIPVRKSLRQTERFRAMGAQHAFAQQIEAAEYFPPTPFVFEYLTEFDLAVERALRGRATPEAALRTAGANIERVMRRYEASEAAAADTVAAVEASP